MSTLSWLVILASGFAGAAIGLPPGNAWRKNLRGVALLLGVGAVVAWMAPGLFGAPAGAATLQAGGFEGRVWAAREVPAAIATSRRQIGSLGAAVASAELKGDIALAFIAMTESTKVLATWNDQGEATKVAGRDCWLAVMHVSTGAAAVANGLPWAERSQFDSALADCKP